jgi:hypothetical protein
MPFHFFMIIIKMSHHILFKLSHGMPVKIESFLSFQIDHDTTVKIEFSAEYYL